MQFDLRQSARMVIALVLVTLFLVPTDLVAQRHVVSPADLQKEVLAASQARQHNLDTVRQFLSSPVAEKAIKSAKMDPQQVRTAAATLNGLGDGVRAADWQIHRRCQTLGQRAASGCRAA